MLASSTLSGTLVCGSLRAGSVCLDVINQTWSPMFGAPPLPANQHAPSSIGRYASCCATTRAVPALGYMVCKIEGYVFRPNRNISRWVIAWVLCRVELGGDNSVSQYTRRERLHPTSLYASASGLYANPRVCVYSSTASHVDAVSPPALVSATDGGA